MNNRTRYLLVCLMEECGEVIQAASKCLRHGENNHHPDTPQRTNTDDLLDELQDFYTIRRMLQEEGKLKIRGEENSFGTDRYWQKHKRVSKYMEL